MNFCVLEDSYQKWRGILAIGKTMERHGENYHILGMTLGECPKLYILEPFHPPAENEPKRKGANTQRKLLKTHNECESAYLHCREIAIGNQVLGVQGGSSSPLGYSTNDYGIVQLFFDMLGAGWQIPPWLKELGWDDLQLVTLELSPVKKLPHYSPQLPITICHAPVPRQHIIEKTITLQVGKSRSFAFIDNQGCAVQCHINKVFLIDVWQTIEERFSNPQFTQKLSAQELQQIKNHCYESLAHSCPRGMCYIGIEYECSKNMGLQFFSKEFLKSSPQNHEGGFSNMAMSLKPDEKTGAHQLPLRGTVIETPVAPDTTKIPAELFFCFEIIDPWDETIL